jgi:hypothetical protein
VVLVFLKVLREVVLAVLVPEAEVIGKVLLVILVTEVLVL